MFLALLFCLLALPCSAQDDRTTATQAVTDAWQRQAGDYAALYQGLIEPPFPYALYRAHPYEDDDDFHEGTLCFRGRVYHGVGMRLDIQSHRLVVRTPERKIAVVPVQQDIDWFVKDGRTYRPVQGRFCRLEHDGHLLSLYTLREKVRTRDIQEGRHSYMDLRTQCHFLLVTADGQSTEVQTLRDLTRLFPARKAQLKAFSQARHLRWKGSDARLYALTACTAWLDDTLGGEALPTRLTPSAADAGTTNTPSTSSAADGLVPFTPDEAPDTLLPVWQAYKGGSHVREQDLESTTLSDNTGISDLETLREYVIDEVEVLASTPKGQTLHAGMEKFRPTALRNVPLAMGEADVLKLVQTLPGVTSTGEASSGFNVRGGSSDQNLLLLGQNTLFNPMHMFGLFSAFNPDMVGETELYKGSIPSRYGGRLSSVMSIAPRVAGKQETHGTASLGLLTAKGTLEVPVVRDKASLLLGARTTYSDWMLSLLPDDSEYRGGNAGFWDLSGVLDITPRAGQRLTLNGYHSHDRFALTEASRYAYDNTNGALEWQMRPQGDEQWRFTLATGIDAYGYRNEDRTTDLTASALAFDILQSFLRGSASHPVGEHHALQGGLQAQYYHLAPGSRTPLGEASNVQATVLVPEQAVESAAFAEDNWTVTPQLSLTGGLRYTLFRSLTAGKEHTYTLPEVRLSAGYSLGDNLSLKAGFNTTSQYIHKVSNTVIMSPTDTWTLSNRLLRPERGWQLSAGVFWLSDDSQYELSAEAYIKRMRDVLTYRSGAVLVMNPALEDDVVAAEGRAGGIELQARKHTGDLTGWISYCYSRTLLRQCIEQDASGSGDWYPADYDRPHQVKFVGNYKFTRRYSLSLNADYSTGRPVTIPAGKFYSQSQGRPLPYYTRRNGYRLPDYFRLDASFNIEPGHHLTQRTHGWLSLGVYNLTGRRNAYSVWYQADQYGIQGYQLSVFGCPIPFITYNIRF